MSVFPTYRVVLRYTETPVDGGTSCTLPQEVIVRQVDADTPERAGWLGKVQIRVAYAPQAIRIHSWIVEEEGTDQY